MTEARPVLRFSCLAAAFAATMAITAQSRAAFTLVDNFPEPDGTALSGTTSADGGTWSTDAGLNVEGGQAQWTIAAAHWRSELTLPSGSGIAEGNTGTLFFQVAPSGNWTAAVGDNSDNNVTNPLAALRFNFGAIQYMGATATSFTTVGSGYTQGTTYNVWIVLNTAANTFDAYIQGGTQYVTQTQIVTGQSFTSNNDTEARYLEFRTNNGPSIPLNLDNLYLDTHSANLADPTAVTAIPAPIAAESGLALLGAMMVGTRRRR